MKFSILEESRQFNNCLRLWFHKNGNPSPHLLMTFDYKVCDVLDWPNDQFLRLQIGINGHQGMMRIATSPTATPAKFIRTGSSAKTDFGPMSGLYTEPRPPRSVDVTVVTGDSTTLEFKMPTWEETLPNPFKRKPTVPNMGPKVLFTPQAALVFKGTQLPLYEYQAAMLFALVKFMGKPLNRNSIIDEGYRALGRPPHPAATILLERELDGLRAKLKPLNLDLRYDKEAGYSLHTEDNSG